MSPEVIAVVIAVIAAPFALGAIWKSTSRGPGSHLTRTWKALADKLNLSFDPRALRISGDYREYPISVQLPYQESSKPDGNPVFDTDGDIEITVSLKYIWTWGLTTEVVDQDRALSQLDAIGMDAVKYELEDGFHFEVPPFNDPDILDISFGLHAHLRELLGEGTGFKITDGTLHVSFPILKYPDDLLHQLNMAVDTAHQFDKTDLFAVFDGTSPPLIGSIRIAPLWPEEESSSQFFIGLAVDLGDAWPDNVEVLNKAENDTALSTQVEAGDEETSDKVTSDEETGNEESTRIETGDEEFDECFDVYFVDETDMTSAPLNEQARAILLELLNSGDDPLINDRKIKIATSFDGDEDEAIPPTEWFRSRLELIDQFYAAIGDANTPF